MLDEFKDIIWNFITTTTGTYRVFCVCVFRVHSLYPELNIRTRCVCVTLACTYRVATSGLIKRKSTIHNTYIKIKKLLI